MSVLTGPLLGDRQVPQSAINQFLLSMIEHVMHVSQPLIQNSRFSIVTVVVFVSHSQQHCYTIFALHSVAVMSFRFWVKGPSGVLAVISNHVTITAISVLIPRLPIPHPLQTWESGCLPSGSSLILASSAL